MKNVKNVPILVISIIFILTIGVFMSIIGTPAAGNYAIGNYAIGNYAIGNYAPIGFMTIGDPHLGKYVTDDEEQRLIQAVNYANSRTDIDFVVVMGDIANNGTAEEFSIGKYILSKLNKPYYMVAGNHDIRRNGSLFGTFFGPMENISVVKGYQLLFIGITNQSDNTTGTPIITLNWSFDFNNNSINKSVPTIVFLHGPVQNAPAGCCIDINGSTKNWDNSTTYYKYASTMQPELDQFPYLIAVYSGHVHVDTNQTINGTEYITIASLTNNTNVGWLAPPSDNVGLSLIDNNGVLNYNLVNYFTMPPYATAILFHSPISPIVANTSPSTVTFNAILEDRQTDLIWQFDGIPVQQNISSIFIPSNYSYTNTAYIGKHSVIANPISYGAVPYIWAWNVTGNFVITDDKSLLPVGATNVTFTVTRACGTEQLDNCSNNISTMPVPGAKISLGANTSYTGYNMTDINGTATLTINAPNEDIIRATATKYLYNSNSTDIFVGFNNGTENLSIVADAPSIYIGSLANITFTVTRACGIEIGDNCTNITSIPLSGAKVTLNGSNGTYSGYNMTGADGRTIFTINATKIGTIRASVTKYRFYSNYVNVAVIPIPIITNGGSGGGGGGSGGGGGGGGGGTAEPYDNILKYETQENYVTTIPTPFKYVTPELGVFEVDITGIQNGDASLRIEVLKDTSKLVDSPASNLVYKNINMWIDFKRVQNATIQYKVENSWIDNNKISTDSIKMLRWDNNTKKWNELLTTNTGKDGIYTYFESQTPGFSSFAIRGNGNVLSTLDVIRANIPGLGTPVPAATEIIGNRKIPLVFVGVMAVFIVMLIFYLVRMKKNS